MSECFSVRSFLIYCVLVILPIKKTVADPKPCVDNSLFA